jgi:hypothetical protein
VRALAVRLHSANITGTGTAPLVRFELIQVAPTQEDPAPSNGAGFFRADSKCTVDLVTAGSTSSPSLKVVALTSPFFGLLSLKMTVQQFGSTVTNYTFVVSADLNLKS